MLVRQCGLCLDWGVPRLVNGLCWSCRGWLENRETARCPRCCRVCAVDGDGLCRPCVIALREEIRAGFAAVFPGPAQLHVFVLGLGQQGARNLPRPRGSAAPFLGPREVRGLVDDPRICPAVIRGQLTLFPVRRRFERGDARRISGRTWPEEEALQALAGQRAASAGRSGTWPQMVLRLIRCALAIRDAEGEALVREEMLDQVRLPMKAAAAELLGQAGLLRPRTNPPPVSWPARSCADCGCWGVTATLCRGCDEWRKNRDRYRVDRCPRCRRDGLPLHAGKDLCRGCLAYVREAGPQMEAVSFTQLAFAGPLAHQLKRRAGELGFVVHQRSGPLSRARARVREVSAPASQAVQAPALAGQLALFWMPRTWRCEPHAPVLALPPLPVPAQLLLHTFTAGYPRVWLPTNTTCPAARPSSCTPCWPGWGRTSRSPSGTYAPWPGTSRPVPPPPAG